MFEGVLGYVVGGALIGILARFIKPGADPMGWIPAFAGMTSSFLQRAAIKMIGQDLRDDLRDPTAGWDVQEFVGAVRV